MNRPFKYLAQTEAKILCTSGGTLKRIHGFWNGGTAGGTDAYLHLYDAITTPANADPAPASLLKPLLLQANFVYDYNFAESPIAFENGLIAVVSAARDEKSDMPEGGEFDLLGAMDTVEPDGLTDSGDQASSDTLQIWNDAATNRLYRIKVTGNTQADVHLQIHAADLPDDGVVPLYTWNLPASLDICFGRKGVLVGDDCFMAISTDSVAEGNFGKLNASTEGEATLRAWYFA